MNNLIKSKLELLPTSPGCYIHKDKNGTIIYVGKAKNLRNRVRSYFRGSHDTKTEALVSEIVDFEFIVTESNIEALLLEINLIKENKPKYNIMLKDDKSYPFIKITNERYPRLIITRQVKRTEVFILDPIPMWGQPMKSSGCWIGYSLFVSVPTRPLRSVFITISVNAWPTPSVRRMRLISSLWPRRFLIF